MNGILKLVALSGGAFWGQRLRAVLLLGVILGSASGAEAQVVPCSPGLGGPPPGSLPRAIAKAPPLAYLPNVPIPGAWLWVLYDNRHVTLLHIPTTWPAASPNPVVTINLDALPTFGIPANYVLYDLATGPGNTGLGVIYTSVWVLGLDPGTGERRAQLVGLSPGTPPGGCFCSGPAQTLNPRPAVIAAVEYPPNSITNYLWVLRPEELAVEAGTATPDQRLAIQHLPSGSPLQTIDEDQILCPPGMNCPNWGDTFIQQIHQTPGGGGLRLLLHEQTTGNQRLGLLNPGGFFGFTGCSGAINPCLAQLTNLPAPINGHALDIADSGGAPGPLWVLWSGGLSSTSEAAAAEGETSSTSSDSLFPQPAQPSSTTYILSALGSDGTLLGSIPLLIPDGSNQAPEIDLSPASLDFGEAAPGARSERTLVIRNLGQAGLAVSSITMPRGAGAPFDFCGSIPTGFSLRPGEARELRVCFTPQAAGAFQNALAIGSNDPDESLVTVPLSGRTTSAAQLTTKLAVDRGCGASYAVGDQVTISFRVDFPTSLQTSPSATVRLKVQKPGSPEQVLGAGPVLSGVTYTLRATVGDPPGERQLTLETEIVALQLHSTTTCVFTAVASRQPRIQVEPQGLNFGLVAVGEARRLSFRLTNAGTADLFVNSMLPRQGTPFDFCGLIPTGFTLRPQESHLIEVCASPRAASSFQDAIVIRSNDPNNPAVALPVAVQASKKTRLTCQVSKRQVTPGEPMEISGKLEAISASGAAQPLGDKLLTVILRRPDGIRQSILGVKTQANGVYSLQGVSTPPLGDWTIEVSWEGDADHFKAGPESRRWTVSPAEHKVKIAGFQSNKGQVLTRNETQLLVGCAGEEYEFSIPVQHLVTDEHKNQNHNLAYSVEIVTYKEAANQTQKVVLQKFEDKIPGGQGAIKVRYKWEQPGTYAIGITLKDELHEGVTDLKAVGVVIREKAACGLLLKADAFSAPEEVEADCVDVEALKKQLPANLGAELAKWVSTLTSPPKTVKELLTTVAKKFAEAFGITIPTDVTDIPDIAISLVTKLPPQITKVCKRGDGYAVTFEDGTTTVQKGSDYAVTVQTGPATFKSLTFDEYFAALNRAQYAFAALAKLRDYLSNRVFIFEGVAAKEGYLRLRLTGTEIFGTAVQQAQTAEQIRDRVYENLTGNQGFGQYEVEKVGNNGLRLKHKKGSLFSFEADDLQDDAKSWREVTADEPVELFPENR